MGTKLFIMFLCAAAGLLTGLAFYKNSENRKKYFEEALGFIDYLESDLKFRQTGLRKLIEGYCEGNKSRFKEMLTAFARDPSKGGEINAGYELKGSEKTLVREFLSRIGTVDLGTQLFELSSYRQRFSVIAQATGEKHKKYSSLYVKLGFLAGLLIGIILM